MDRRVPDSANSPHLSARLPLPHHGSSPAATFPSAQYPTTISSTEALTDANAMAQPPQEPAQRPTRPIERPQPSKSHSEEHDSLKYHLLGPSLTKAGQDSVDQQKVSEVIYNASKGSKFFNNEEAKDKNLTEKINRILVKKRQLDKLDVSSDLRRADDYIAELELGRDLTQVVVHIDCDAFYAAVEELDRPELKDVPMAVGKGVLTTCNYHARKFGCRSGMAGFVAMKLCPQLICVPMDFTKYAAKAEEVRTVLAEYDPRFESASCDEAYLNITQYCQDHNMSPEEAVNQMRAEVHERTKITVSAGIAANAKLAKIVCLVPSLLSCLLMPSAMYRVSANTSLCVQCSNKNKPNGQFHLVSDRQTIMEFMKALPTRKVNGIGRVFERELDAIGIKTCGDIYEYRAYLAQLFGQKAFQFLMQCYLGLGRTSIQPAEDYERKSVGTETTFKELHSPEALREKLRAISEELEGDLKRTEYKGRTLCIKIKLHTYEVYTRQMTPPFAIHRAEDLYKYSLPMLEKLMKEMPSLRLRLMGLRVTHIVSTKKPGIDFFGRHRAATNAGKPSNASTTENSKWEVWPEAEFEEAARQERDDEMNELEKLSQEFEKQQVSNTAINPPTEQREEERWTCPICASPQPPNDTTFNAHIDFCLSRQTIKEAVKETAPSPSPNTPKALPVSSIKQPLLKKKGKRGRPKNEPGTADEKTREKRRAFFTISTSSNT
jgi:DNA polymerase kappa